MREHRTEQQQGTVRRKVATAAVAIGVVLLGIAVAPGVASAHVPNVSDECGGLEVSLVLYEPTPGPGLNNRITVTIDSASQIIDFDGGYSNTFTWPETVNHTWSVVLDANRNNGNATQYDRSFSGTQVACKPPTTTTTTLPEVTTTLPEVTTTLPEVTTTLPEVTTTLPEVTTTQPGVTTTQPEVTTTLEQAAPTTTVLAGQEGPTSTVGQSSGAATTTETIGRTLPATGNGDGSANLIVVALTLIGFGAVMLRFASKPSR